MIAAVEASAGRARKTTHVPFLVGHEKEALKDRKQYLRFVRPGPFCLRSFHSATNVDGLGMFFCRHMRKRRRHWKGQWLKRLIRRVEDAAKMGDWGCFY